MYDFLNDPRFKGIERIIGKCLLASPTIHGDEKKLVDEAIDSGWVTTAGRNIDKLEEAVASYVGVKYAVGLSTGTAALHLATKLAGEKLYGQPRSDHGTLEGKRVFCSDVTFDASVNPVAYEGGEAVFIDTEYDTWNMDPVALEKAFSIYPDVRLIVLAHLYGTPGKVDKIKKIADEHGALIIEDAAESFGAKYKIGDQWVETGSLGDYNCISFNGNKIITGSSGGMFLTDSIDDANKVRKWATQSREEAPWYQHEEIGYNYRMSHIIASMTLGQLPYLQEHIEAKRAIYQRYKEGLKDLPVSMNPYDVEKSEPNFWLSCILIDESAMGDFVRGEKEQLWTRKSGKSSPGEILDAMAVFGAEGRPIWKPMHCQPIYRSNAFITSYGNGRARSNAYISGVGFVDVGADIFHRGLCLPSDNKMTVEQQNKVIEIIHRCFQ